MSAPRYSAYKESNVAWLGLVPSHWHVHPFKWAIERNDGGVWGDDPDGVDDTIVLRSTEQTVDGHWRMDDPAPRKLSSSERAAALLAEGDLVVTKSSGSSLHIGKTTIVTEEIAALGCCYSNFMQRIRTRSTLLPKMAWYVMNNHLARLQFDLTSNSTTGLANLNGTMIGGIVLPVPPVDEQASIAAFLDRETAKIDALVEEQKRLIELLKEKRQAVISQAVTKGLDPNVPMKDSGVEWLGEVPAHWDVHRNKVVFAEIDDRNDDGVGELMTVSHLTGVTPRSEKNVNMILAETLDGYKRGLAGDLVINTMWAWMGALGVSPCDGLFSPSYNVYRIRDSSRLLPSYYDYLCRVPQHVTEMKSKSTGIWESRLRLYPDAFLNMRLCLPPLAEQAEIVTVLAKQLNALDALNSEAEQGIQLLLERRSALISAAVTGKIDVRGLAPQPEGQCCSLSPRERAG